MARHHDGYMGERAPGIPNSKPGFILSNLTDPCKASREMTRCVNRGGLCVKGRYGLDFIHHPDRLTSPLIRKETVSKHRIPEKPEDAFRKADWEEALSYISHKLSSTIHDHGSNAIGVLSSAKCTNEDNYIIQKFARAVLGTNNVDHCARLCHASTVTAALAAFGSGAMSNSISDIDTADLLFVIGSNTTECHPIIGRRIKHVDEGIGTSSGPPPCGCRIVIDERATGRIFREVVDESMFAVEEPITVAYRGIKSEPT